MIGHPESVWTALAEPTRRALLERLREGPRTTGDLCRSFPTSRFAVMKHLDVLAEAGLVVVERRGRDRWNHLEPGPLQPVADWIRRHAAPKPQGKARDEPDGRPSVGSRAGDWSPGID